MENRTDIRGLRSFELILVVRGFADDDLIYIQAQNNQKVNCIVLFLIVMYDINRPKHTHRHRVL